MYIINKYCIYKFPKNKIENHFEYEFNMIWLYETRYDLLI